jgi:serine protease Do
MKLWIRACAAVAVMAFSAPVFAADVPASFADLVEKLTPAVVNISTTQKIRGGAEGMQMFESPEGGEMPEEFRNFLQQFGGKQGGGGKPQEHEVYSLGSGFIIDPDGYIATNNHVIADAEEITVILSDDSKLKAKLIGRDPKTDLALLKVDAGHKLPSVTLGDSDVSRVGDWVIAIGNPFGLGGTVTAGIISARARNINAGQYDDFIQTDAAINRGNSGGPLFNVKGEVVGVNTAIYSPSGGSIGIGFAVPMAEAKPVFMQLKTSGHIDRGWLGVKIQTVTDEIADSVGLKKAMGALVMEVAKDSPADKAEIKVGDVITKFDGKDVKEMRQLPRMVAETKKGKGVPVEIWRNGKSQTVQLTVGELKEEAEAAEAKDKNAENAAKGNAPTKEILGMSLSTLTGDLREHYSIADTVKGVVVTKITPASEAMKRGLHVGDAITQVGNATIASIQELDAALAQTRKAGHKFALVRVQRGEESLFITLPTSEK